MSRRGATGIYDSSLLTSTRRTRSIFSNVLAQQTAIGTTGRPFMVIQGGGGGADNSCSIAAETGSNTLTRAEINAVIASQTPPPSGPPTLTFASNGTTLNISTIPAGYTSLNFTICGGGGAGENNGDWGGGGGSGGYLYDIIPVSAGQSISVTLGAGGVGNTGSAGNGGEATTLTLAGTTFTAGGGGGGGVQSSTGGTAGVPGGTAGGDVISEEGSYAGGNGGSGGGGGGGGGQSGYRGGIGGTGANGASSGTAGSSGSSGAGGNGYYRIVLT